MIGLFVFGALCAIWLGTLALVTWGVRSLRYLRDSPAADAGDAKVSIIVAARDEAAAIEHALQSLLAQEQASSEVTVVNDRSVDATGEILRRTQQQHPSLRVIEIETLPPGWLGKNHALHRAAALATGDYLLFTDADVLMAPTAVARAVSHAEANRLDHLAVFPEVPAPNFWTGASFAMFGLGFLMLTQPWFARSGRTPMPIGVGAFNLVRRAKYLEIGGHSTIALRPDDDVALAGRLHATAARQDVLIGAGMISVEWYGSLREFVRGLEKNTFAPFGYSLPKFLTALTLHFVTYVVPWSGLLLGGPVAVLAAITIVAQMLTLSATHGTADRPWRYAPVMPIAALIFEYVIARAVFLTLRNGGIRWRETFYPLELLRTNVEW